MIVIGIQRNMQFKAQDGNLITGMNLFVTTEKNNVEGLACEKVFISGTKECFPELVKGLKVGDEVQLLYNRYGKVESVLVR